MSSSVEIAIGVRAQSFYSKVATCGGCAGRGHLNETEDNVDATWLQCLAFKN